MKKKLFLLLLIVALAAFVFTGCTPPAEGEGEGGGEDEAGEGKVEQAIGSLLCCQGCANCKVAGTTYLEHKLAKEYGKKVK